MKMQNTLQERKREIKESMEAVKNHFMCHKFYEEEGLYRVTYLNRVLDSKYKAYVDGVQASKGGGKGVALRRMIDMMNRHETDIEIGLYEDNDDEDAQY